MGKGEKERFDVWISAHLGVLARIARSFATGADQPDLMQELMFAVWRAAPSFRGEAKETTFLFRVAHNAALTWRRRERARQRRQEEYERLMVPESTGRDGTVVSQLYDAIRQLDALDRSLILLSLEGVNYSEIAEIHGLSETNVGARLSRARKKLARLMEVSQ
jgi:RNA polymerase sigma factor (sigma-70 family)